MRKLVLIALVRTSPVFPTESGKERPPTTWTGIPDGPRACSWIHERGECVAGGAAFSCVHDRGNNLIACARTSPVFPTESGK